MLGKRSEKNKKLNGIDTNDDTKIIWKLYANSFEPRYTMPHSNNTACVGGISLCYSGSGTKRKQK